MAFCQFFVVFLNIESCQSNVKIFSVLSCCRIIILYFRKVFDIPTRQLLGLIRSLGGFDIKWLECKIRTHRACFSSRLEKICITGPVFNFCFCIVTTVSVSLWVCGLFFLLKGVLVPEYLSKSWVTVARDFTFQGTLNKSFFYSGNLFNLS